MLIGIIGTGEMASGLGRGWCEAGHEVVFGSRVRERAEALADLTGAGADGGSIEHATRRADVVVLAVPWTGAEELIRQAPWTRRKHSHRLHESLVPRQTHIARRVLRR